MNILFIYPIIRPHEQPIHCPYELLQLASIAEQLGHKLKIVDNNAYRLPIDAFRQEVKPETKWDLIVIQADKQQGKQLAEVAKITKEINALTCILCFGELVSSIPHQIMKWIPEIDAGIIDAPYTTFRSILNGSFGAGFWNKHKGLIYWEGKKLKLSKPHKVTPEEIETLDAVAPYPLYEKAPIETYFKYSSLLYSPESSGYIPLNLNEILRRLDIKTSYQNPFRQHSPEYVTNLIMHLRLQFGVNFISFTDENFTADRKWFGEFLDKLEEKDLAGLIKWGINSSALSVDGGLLNRAHDLGLSYVFFNGESGSDQLKDTLGLTPLTGNSKQMSAALKATHVAAINPIMSFKVGFPSETFQNVAETCQFMIDNQVHWDPQFYVPPLNLYREEIIDQQLTKQEKTFLECPEPETYRKIFQKDTTVSAIAKNFEEIKSKIDDEAFKRWVYSLDDNKLTLNLTPLTDAELAGAKYLLATHDIDKINEHESK